MCSDSPLMIPHVYSSTVRLPPLGEPVSSLAEPSAFSAVLLSHPRRAGSTSETPVCGTALGQSIRVHTSPHDTSLCGMWLRSVSPYLGYAFPVLFYPLSGTAVRLSLPKPCPIFHPSWCGGTCRLLQSTGGGQQ